MMEFAQPPPSNANFAVPPPPVQNMPSHLATSQSPGTHYQNHQRERHFHHGGFSGKGHFRSYNFRGGAAAVQDDFDGKRLRKSVMRKTVDYNSSIVREIEVCTISLDQCGF